MTRGKWEPRNHEISKKVESLRLSFGWTWGQFDRASGVDKSTLRHVLKLHDRNFSLEALHKVKTALAIEAQRRDSAADQNYVVALIAPGDATHSQPAEMYERQAQAPGRIGRNNDAAGLLFKAAQKCADQRNWAKWASHLLKAGSYLMNPHQFEKAISIFKTVEDSPHLPLGDSLAKVEAKFRQGWARYSLEKYEAARSDLMDSLRRADELAATADSHEVQLLRKGAYHFLGRTLLDKAIKESSLPLAKEGLDNLNKAYAISRECGLPIDQGWDLLRPLPALLTFERLTDFAPGGHYRGSRYLLDQCKDLMGAGGETGGNLYIYRAVIATKDDPIGKTSERAFNKAEEELFTSGFFPAALCRLFRERSLAASFGDEDIHTEQALRYALVGSLFRPYGETMARLQDAGKKRFERMGKDVSVFHKYWYELLEDVLLMNKEPFSSLKQILRGLGDTQGPIYIIETLQKINDQYPKIIRPYTDPLLRNPSATIFTFSR